MKPPTLILIFCFLFAGTIGFAHHGDPEEDLETTSRYLESVFVRLENSPSDAGVRPFEFVDSSGRAFFLARAHLTETLVAAVELSEHSEHHAHPENWREKLAEAISYLPVGSVKLMGGAAEIASHYGVLPLIVVMATWPPYSFVTEALESFVVGPFHIWCTVSQMAYFGALRWLVSGGQILTEAFLHRGSTLGIWDRLKVLFSSRRERARFQKSLERVVLTEIPAVMNRSDFIKTLLAKRDTGNIGRSLAFSSAWGDLYGSLFNVLNARVRRHTSDVETALNNGVSGISDLMGSVEALAALVSTKQTLLMETGQLSSYDYVVVKRQMGRLSGSLGRFERNLWLLAHEPDERAAAIGWANATFQQFIDALRLISRYTGKEKQEVEKSVSELIHQVGRYSGNCIHGVLVAGGSHDR